MRQQVVKVQRSLFSNELPVRVLVYNERGTFFVEVPMTDELSDLLAGRNKAYFHARIQGTELETMGEAEGQDW